MRSRNVITRLTAITRTDPFEAARSVAQCAPVGRRPIGRCAGGHRIISPVLRSADAAPSVGRAASDICQWTPFRRGIAAGGDATLQIGETLSHVYQSALGTPEAATATRQIADFIGRR
jgi:hypothetical protein